MQSKILNKSVSASIWQLLYVFTGFIGNIALARILDPVAFGKASILMFFINIANVLVSGGMSGYLIRKKTCDSADYSTLFIFNFIVSLLLSGILVFFSPYIAEYYNDSSLKRMMCVLALIPILNSLIISSETRMIRLMDFNRRGLYKFIALFSSMVIAILIALVEKSPWSLLCLYTLNPLFIALLFNYRHRSFLKITFKKDLLRKMFSFGFFLTLSNLLRTGVGNLHRVIIGKYFSFSIVGNFSLGNDIQNVGNSLYGTIINNVFFSHLSRLSYDKKAFEVNFNKINGQLSVLVSLITIVTIFYANEFVNIFFGDKWESAGRYLQFFSISSLFLLFDDQLRVIYKVYNITHKILFITVFKQAIVLICIVVGVYKGSLYIILSGILLSNIVGVLISFFYVKKISPTIVFQQLTMITKLFVCVCGTLVISFYVSNIIPLFGFYKIYLFPLLILIFVFSLILLKITSIRELHKIILYVKSFNCHK